jgi:hypothetical protein
MFDSDNQIKLAGKVKEFHWQNPHVCIHLMAPAKWQEAEWTIQCANPGILNRIGWKFNMIKEGDAHRDRAPAAHGRTRRPAREVTLAATAANSQRRSRRSANIQ